VPEEE
jgi:hypothetical protein